MIIVNYIPVEGIDNIEEHYENLTNVDNSIANHQALCIVEISNQFYIESITQYKLWNV